MLREVFFSPIKGVGKAETKADRQALRFFCLLDLQEVKVSLVFGSDFLNLT
jgi:hypothetical protein